MKELNNKKCLRATSEIFQHLKTTNQHEKVSTSSSAVSLDIVLKV